MTMRYELVTFTPTREFVAVYHTGPLPPGRRLWTWPLDGVGLARVTEPGRLDGAPRVEVVGLLLTEGAWEVANEAANYCGMCRPGDDARYATVEADGLRLADLHPDYRTPEDGGPETPPAFDCDDGEEG